MHPRPAPLVRFALGFGLVELMVAMAISLLLLTGVVAIFSNSRAAYETTDRLSRIQENGRFALDRLLYDIRRSGFVGCARVPNFRGSSLADQGNIRWNFLESPVRGFQSTGTAWSPALPAIVPNAAPGSDAILVRVPARNVQPVRVSADMSNRSSDVAVDNPGAFQANDIALIYNCEAQGVFQVTGVAGGALQHVNGVGFPGNASALLAFPFPENAEVVPVETVVYYVRPSTADPTINSLWRIVINRPDAQALASAEELVEGIEQLQILYGVDTNGNDVADAYVTADAVTNWDRVFSVSVALLVRSLTAYGGDTDQRPYQLLDVAVPAAQDRFLRQMFTGTATIRNRAIVN
jgi:type IV pilus assembly protein PilW